MAENNKSQEQIEAEGEGHYFEGEGDYAEGDFADGVFIEGEDGEIIDGAELASDNEEEAMAHTTDEEDKKQSEYDESFQVEDLSIGSFHEHGDHIYAVCQHPTMKNIMLSGGGDDRVLVWDMKEEEKQKNTLLEIKEGFKDSIEYIKFNYDHKYLLITGQGNPIRIYKVEEEDGKPEIVFKSEIEMDDDINFVTWHNKANLFLTGGNDMMIWMFNAINGEFTTYAGHEAPVNDAQFSPDGKLIVSISTDWTARVWNPRTGKCLRTIRDEKSFHSVDISSMFLINESLVTGDAEGYIFISQIKTGETYGPITKHNDSVEWITGNVSKSIAWGSLDGVIKIIDLGKQCLSIDISKLEDGGGITRMKWSPTKPYIYVGSTIGTLYWFDMRSGEIIKKYTAHHDSIMDFIVDEEDEKIVTVGDDKIAYVFDL